MISSRTKPFEQLRSRIIDSHYPLLGVHAD